MRKTKVFIMCAGILLLLVVGIIFYYSKSTIISEVHRTVKQTGMLANSGGFTLNEKDEVKISVRSSIKEGDALITLLNENGDVLYTFDTNCSQKESFSLEAGHYTFRVDSDKFRGKYDIVVRK